MKQKTRRRLQNIGVLILLCLCLAWVADRFWGFTSSTFTDNAHVERLIVPVDCRVQGFVKEVRFDDYTRVHKGDTLAIIDNTEFLLRVAQAKADLKNASTGKDASNSSISTTMNNVAVNEAAIAEVGVLLDNAERDLVRYQGLLEKEAVTQHEFDGVKANRDALKAKYDMLVKQRESTSMTAGEQKVRLGQNDAAIDLAKAALRLAELNLSYTVILAPCDGYCSRKTIRVGQLVQPGQTIVDIVDANDMWVTANYKERQTSRMQVGDSVYITVDAVPGITFHGTVSDIAAATGAAFSPAASNDAVGNFVKIEKRIPVKIRFTTDNPREDLAKLRAGMNAECRVVEKR